MLVPAPKGLMPLPQPSCPDSDTICAGLGDGVPSRGASGACRVITHQPSRHCPTNRVLLWRGEFGSSRMEMRVSRRRLREHSPLAVDGLRFGTQILGSV